ncbi:hypothetical protein JOQ06_006221 [Pogonophryne albipinna]|uniref:Small RNA 2'-O-methyltransferase n=1 Tax=Pogonophryne albipinna TaxID=1090488 RepID=A0AAD6BH13_9TELE|nr:hypothetical protein JOQ06_006221 [Pogonophryne albipinna]
MEPMFTPALHRQRHQFVIDFVKRKKPKKVLDLGCCECVLLKQLKFHREIERLPSYDQLRIELYQGSVTEKDARLRGFDLVTSIELIEHLTLADVELFSEVVFGYLTPEAVIVSTPNSDFNPFLPGLVGFRHIDHKFEWTRAEFKSWAMKVCLQYGYEVELTGVGQAPPGQRERVGFCSQIGVFHRLGGKERYNMFDEDAEDVFSYTLLYSIIYPSLHDNNILRRVLMCEVVYWAEKLKRRWIAEETGERDDTDYLCQAEGEGGECFRASERHVDTEETQTAACGAEMKTLVDQEEEDGELFWRHSQPDSDKWRRRVSVPLAVLWCCCPKVSVLSGSVSNLRTPPDGMNPELN